MLRRSALGAARILSRISETQSVSPVVLQQRYASSHSEDTNTFIKEVCAASRFPSVYNANSCIRTRGLQASGKPLLLVCYTVQRNCEFVTWQYSNGLRENGSCVPLYHQALQELEYPAKLQKLLLTPERELVVELVITRDNNEIETFNAYRVQHDNSRGPYKGGLRYHPQVDLDDVRRCAIPDKVSMRSFTVC
jgi:Glu/Leu/Phe/Val dehydrogenase, dimerisation domain